MSQKNSRIGAIGEHMAATQLMLRGWDALNANASITNMSGIDLVCMNSKKQASLIQVKTAYTENNFPTGLTMEQAKDRKLVERHVVGPWIFVRAKGKGADMQFTYYILRRQQVIDLILKGNDWYLNKVNRNGKTIKETSVCGILEAWLNGKDYKAPKLDAEEFINPLKGEKTQDAWDNIWK